ncbi:alanine/glycine:cation symporter family protein [Virgibacillus halodenitrificans]|jgi:alanine or glycine:cation symporter, AGCS family|uniref:Sodium:alanine symporter family protein n=1 Tax=Virgibacillus halodenitrificans TaxID=1482 RepID=A0AAC9IX71_VIRHA|nr:sodium:alanine symporter family protein [Virgibacillus halodenitrificans]APC46998.1 sodium:alanine symporter family protein [Virgibacillus halodenitrificans]MCG1027404.1 sodium:alanine symporter family protein [Virgibacillus halodenitrificans]MEC2159094.1 sodium:alanine symporter family protein [Virgibacillus halodenitrificans]MYL46817.1 amino acid carrier protein [Virgibacillus halodenitrificans]CDQ37200.1 Amino-acid carrier protein AlsT [Virgibacillus halodenitrificans]
MLTGLKQINDILWGAPSLILLVGTGLFLTFILKGLQFSKLFYALKLAFSKDKEDSETEGDVSNFKALMTSLAGMIGNGNIAGVATAVTLGGPGAIFWMWVVGLLGMATKYAEALLAMKYRVKNESGEYSSGPMYYIERGLGKKWKPLAVAFAFFGAFAALGIGNSVQSNTIADVMQNSFNVKGVITGVILVVLTSLIIFGGLKRISSVAGVFVPVMAVFYIGASLLILGLNYDQIGPAFSMIFTYAFNPVSAVGGFSGIVVMEAVRNGVSKGIFSNEAGLGTVALIAGNAKTSHPVKQALVAMTGTFIVTIIVCTMTGLVLLVTGFWDTTGGLLSGVSHDPTLDAGALTSAAFGSSLGNIGEYIVSISVVFFGFSTILGWYVYGTKCFEYLFGLKYLGIYRFIYVGATFIGTVASLTTVWAFADMANALMMIPNLIGLLFLYKVIIGETNDYFSRFRKLSK